MCDVHSCHTDIKYLSLFHLELFFFFFLNLLPTFTNKPLQDSRAGFYSEPLPSFWQAHTQTGKLLERKKKSKTIPWGVAIPPFIIIWNTTSGHVQMREVELNILYVSAPSFGEIHILHLYTVYLVWIDRHTGTKQIFFHFKVFIVIFQ